MEKKYRLPKSVTEKWLAALRSGEYEQGFGKLFADGMYCCLGVLGHVCSVPNELMKFKLVFFVDPVVDKRSAINYFDKKTFDNLNIPLEVIGSSSSNKLVNELAHMNDGIGLWFDNKQSFEQIADWIEKNCELYDTEETND